MVFRNISKYCEARGLRVFAALHPETTDLAPQGCRTLILLGPHEPGFWARITSASEFAMSNPVDRWSERVIGNLAENLGARAIFPFGAPPYHPFVAWALKSGCIWQSPINLLVHGQAGLFVSFRGALAFDHAIDLPRPTGTRPCDTCELKPCLTACPAHALTTGAYDVSSCHTYLDQPEGESCLREGCHVRRSCPASQGYQRRVEQSAHHMGFFHKKVEP